MNKGYRSLTIREIDLLEKQSCNAEHWEWIQVKDGFNPKHCLHVNFKGHCFIGDLSGERATQYGFKESNGIRFATIYNCTIGDHVLIEHIKECIANYIVDDHALIRNTNMIGMTGISSFGNGTPVSVLSETRGREVWITDNLTAHTAYIMAMYRHDKELIQAFKKMIDDYVASITNHKGYIGKRTVIKHCGSIKNIRIGDGAMIEGATILENGSVNSYLNAPVHIGHNVICRDFIASSGCEIKGGTTVSHCFIGQGVVLNHLFSAHDSLFFANSQGENGEACAIFAGPYTVSMHKSSLLIAGYFSFLNAGSGSNQSNHLYKLGPIHQGIVERGSKTTSDSYILWPSRIGPFSLIMGRHVHHVDTSKFPFSYLIEDHNKSYLIPGANLRSVGTIRDTKKWPARDRRQGDVILDNINFNLLSPYTVGKMVRGYNKLHHLRETLGSIGQTYVYHDMHIRSSSLEKGLNYYRLGIIKFIGNSIITRLKDSSYLTDNDVRNRLFPDDDLGVGDWVDLAGMIAPAKSINNILKAIKEGVISNLSSLNEQLKEIHQNYYSLEWSWSYQLMLEWYQIKHEDITKEFVRKVVKEWMKAVVELDQMLYEDAKKEFQMNAKVGFGIDVEDDSEKEMDFEEVRGDFDNNPFVLEVLDHIKRKQQLGESMLQQLS